MALPLRPGLPRDAAHFLIFMATPEFYDEQYLKVMRLLESHPHLSQRGLAEVLGVSVGKLNYCLRALVEKGLVKMHNFSNSRRKLAYAYLLTPQGIAAKTELTKRFLRYKIAEYEALRAEIAALESELPHARPHEPPRE
jgi:EPS-associated MarR family transcriptional regulator